MIPKTHLSDYLGTNVLDNIIINYSIYDMNIVYVCTYTIHKSDSTDTKLCLVIQFMSFNSCTQQEKKPRHYVKLIRLGFDGWVTSQHPALLRVPHTWEAKLAGGRSREVGANRQGPDAAQRRTALRVAAAGHCWELLLGLERRVQFIVHTGSSGWCFFGERTITRDHIGLCRWL